MVRVGALGRGGCAGRAWWRRMARCRADTTVRWTSPCRARGFEFEQQKALDELAFKSSSEGHLTGLSTDMAKPF